MKSDTQRKTTVRTRTTEQTRVPEAESITTPAVTTAKTTTEASITNRPPAREAIAKRAYELYLARGKADGHAVEDWVQAERELVASAHRCN